jgi:hypothetical protein
MHDDQMPDDPLHRLDPWAMKKRHPLNPVGWLDRWFTNAAKRAISDEKAYVANPRRLRGLLRWDIGTFIVVIAMVILRSWTHSGTFLDLAAMWVIMFVLGSCLLRRLTRARAYRNGWLDGRMQMVSSMAEAMNRGLTLEQWMDCELERDAEVMKYL